MSNEFRDAKEMASGKDEDARRAQRAKRRKKSGKSSRTSEETRRVGGTPKYNDVHWYIPSDRLLRDSSSLSYNNPLGNSLRVTEYSDTSMGGTYTNLANLDTAIPGIMAIHSIPGVGFSNNNYSPISLAAKSLYARVRKDNSGSKNYDPADLIKYLVALDSAICLFGFFSRMYGVLRLYSAYNRYWPKAVITACNIDFDDMLRHIADARYYLNAYALKINSLFMPSNMNIVSRHFFMYSGLWKDSNVEKSQLYVHVPDAVYQYDEQTTPSRLSPMFVGDATNQPNPITFNDMVDMLDTLANALLASEDIGIISGDMMKAFGAGNAFKLAEIPVDFAATPVYDEMVLAQIQATKFMSRLSVDALRITESVSQDDNAGAILCTPMNTDAAALPNIAHPLNFYQDEVTPEMTMEASRLQAFGIRQVIEDSGGNYVVQNTFDVVGSEFPLYFRILYNVNGSPTFLDISGTSEFTNYIVTGDANKIDSLYTAASAFDHCPLLDRITWSATTGTVGFVQPFAHFDYATYTIVNRAMVRKMHETAFLALFGIDTLTEKF